MTSWVVGTTEPRLSYVSATPGDDREEWLDQTWISEVTDFTSPQVVDSGWVVRLDAHYLGGMWHFGRFEIADIGSRAPPTPPAAPQSEVVPRCRQGSGRSKSR